MKIDNILEMIVIACAVLINLINYIQNLRSGSKIKAIREEVECMNCRLPDYREKEEAKGTHFESQEPVYEWDELQKQVIKTELMRDVKKEIQSYADCALKKMLEKFNIDARTFQGMAPEQAKPIEGVADLSEMKEDLDVLADYYNEAEDIKARYGLKGETPKEIYENLNNLKGAYDKYLQAVTKKEVDVNGSEKEIKPTQE